MPLGILAILWYNRPTMKYLPTGKFAGLKVLLRLDLDLPKSRGGFDTTRLEQGLPTLKYLLDHEVKSVTVIAHRGRPKGPSSQ